MLSALFGFACKCMCLYITGSVHLNANEGFYLALRFYMCLCVNVSSICDMFVMS